MKIVCEEVLDNGLLLEWEAEVQPISKEEASVDKSCIYDWAIMESLDIYEEEEYDWGRVRFFRIVSCTPEPEPEEAYQKYQETEEEYDYVGGPGWTELFSRAPGEVAIVTDGKYMLTGECGVPVRIEGQI